MSHMKQSTPSPVRERQHRVLFSMCLALVLVVASVTALNLALPDIAVTLDATSSQLTWIADGYTVALAGLVLPLGALGDRFGRRHLLVGGATTFGIGALASSFVGSAELLIATRVVMGVGAAAVMPATLSTITSVFPADQRSTAVATWAGFTSAGGIIGLVAAGALMDVGSWRWIFLASTGLAIASVVAALAWTPNTRDAASTPVDLIGSLLTAVGVSALVFGIIEGGQHGFTAGPAVAGYLVAVASLASYVVVGTRRLHPILDPRLFLLRGFSIGSLAIGTQFLALFGFFFVGLQFLQLILGYSPLRSAIALVPVGLTVFGLSRTTPWLVARLGARAVMTTGLLALAIALWCLSSLREDANYWPFLLGTLIAGVGLAWTGPPGTDAVVAALPADKQGVASAMNDAAREVGAAIGIALMGSLSTSAYQRSVSTVVAQLPPAAARAVDGSAAAGLHVAQQLGPRSSAVTHAVRVAFMDGLSHSLSVVVALTLVVGAAVLVLYPRRDRKPATSGEPVRDGERSNHDEPRPEIARALVTTGRPVPDDAPHRPGVEPPTKVTLLHLLAAHGPRARCRRSGPPRSSEATPAPDLAGAPPMEAH